MGAHVLNSPNRRNNGTRRVSWHWLCRLGKGIMWMKSHCSPYHLHYVQTGFGILYSCDESYLLLWIPDFSTKALSCVSECPILTQYSPRASGPWLRETGASFQAPTGSTAESKVHVPVTQCMVGYAFSQSWNTPGGVVGWSSSWVPWHMVLGTIGSTKKLLFLDGDLSCWGVGHHEGEISYLATIQMQL